MSQKLRSDRLKIALRCGRQRTENLEVVLGAPSLWKGWQWPINNLGGCHRGIKPIDWPADELESSSFRCSTK